MTCRGVRGATTVESNTRDEILKATRQLLALMMRQNDIRVDDVASAIFTTSSDVNAEFPALAARPRLAGFLRRFDAHQLGRPDPLWRPAAAIGFPAAEHEAALVPVAYRDRVRIAVAWALAAPIPQLMARRFLIGWWVHPIVHAPLLFPVFPLQR